MRLVIKGRLPSLNEYVRACRTNEYVGAKMKKDCERDISWAIKAQMRGVHFTKPVTVFFFWCEPNAKRDKDNIAFGKKFILDALVKCGVIDNDGWKNVNGFTDQFLLDPQNPRIEVEIFEE